MFDRIRAFLNDARAQADPDRPALAEPTALETTITVNRLDGTKVDLGIVSASYRDPQEQANWDRRGSQGAAQRIEAANAALESTAAKGA